MNWRRNALFPNYRGDSGGYCNGCGWHPGDRVGKCCCSKPHNKSRVSFSRPYSDKEEARLVYLEKVLKKLLKRIDDLEHKVWPPYTTGY